MATIWARIPTGMQAEPNEYGVEIDGNTTDDVIGTDGDGNEIQQANLISGNSMSGVELRGSNQTVGFASSSADIPQLLTLNGSAVVQGSALQLTDASARDPAGSAFTSTPVDIDQFSTQFQFEFQDLDEYDGLTFTIQGQGPTALGAGGDSLGYQGIGRSVAVKFEASDSSDEASDVTGLYSDGASPTVPEISLNSNGIYLDSLDVLQVDMSYSGTTLSVTITDTRTGNSVTQSFQVDIPGTVGGANAYVGFTASTPGNGLNILNWTLTTPSDAHDNRIAGNVIAQEFRAWCRRRGRRFRRQRDPRQFDLRQHGTGHRPGRQRGDGQWHGAARDPMTSRTSRSSSRPPTVRWKAGSRAASRTRPTASMSSPVPATGPAARGGPGFPGDA